MQKLSMKPCAKLASSIRRVPMGLRSRVSTAAVTSTERERVASEQETSTSASAQAPVGKSKWTLPADEVLHSLPEHQAWTYGGMGVMLALLYAGWASADGPVEGLECLLAMFAAYYLADLGSGVYHWIVDNWGDGNTPLIGSQIVAFQGHHQRPWTITQRQFANNVYKIFKPATPIAGFFLLLSPLTDAPFETFMGTFLLLIGLAQEFHKWSHCKKSELPEAVVWAQDNGLLISRKAHGAHHKAPFDQNYSIVSGFWNPHLDRIGFWKGLEKVSFAVTGVKPRSWELPEEWKEMENPTPSA